jgi:5-methylcytosine-specific restriction endonuclease McrA
MQAYKDGRRSDFYAPYGTCRKCGWTGKDWGFKYHGYCNKCHTEWRKEKAEERRRLKPPNENIEVADGITVTRNVRERLYRQAHRDVPPTRKYQTVEAMDNIALFIAMLATFLLIFLAITNHLKFGYSLCLWALMLLGSVVYRICQHIEINEHRKQMPEIDARLEELACERQRQIDETNVFYASSEWRLIREQVIQEQGRICQECGKRITDDFDLTVDHIKPRSKFPKLALDKSNLQVLCRKCNSAKGAIYNEATVSAQLTIR